MSENVKQDRRSFLGSAATTLAATSLGGIRPAGAQSGKTRGADAPRPGPSSTSPVSDF